MKRSGRRSGSALAARSLHWRRNCRCVCDRRSASTSRCFLMVLLVRLRRCAQPSLSNLKSKSDPASRSRPTAHSSRRVQDRSALAKLSSFPSFARVGCSALSADFSRPCRRGNCGSAVARCRCAANAESSSHAAYINRTAALSTVVSDTLAIASVK